MKNIKVFCDRLLLLLDVAQIFSGVAEKILLWAKKNLLNVLGKFEWSKIAAGKFLEALHNLKRPTTTTISYDFRLLIPS